LRKFSKSACVRCASARNSSRCAALGLELLRVVLTGCGASAGRLGGARLVGLRLHLRGLSVVH
jgi:hypothetical protein